MYLLFKYRGSVSFFDCLIEFDFLFDFFLVALDLSKDLPEKIKITNL